MRLANGQRAAADQSADFERLLGNRANNADPVAAAKFREFEFGMRRLFDAEDTARRGDPLLGQLDFVGRQNRALGHKEPVGNIAFVQRNVGRDVGLFEHLSHVGRDHAARHLGDDPVGQERVRELHEPHHFEVKPGRSIVE